MAGQPGADSRPAIGVDLGGTKTEAIVLDAQGQQVWRQRIATPSAQGDEAILAPAAAGPAR